MSHGITTDGILAAVLSVSAACDGMTPNGLALPLGERVRRRVDQDPAAVDAIVAEELRPVVEVMVEKLQALGHDDPDRIKAIVAEEVAPFVAAIRQRVASPVAAGATGGPSSADLEALAAARKATSTTVATLIDLAARAGEQLLTTWRAVDRRGARASTAVSTAVLVLLEQRQVDAEGLQRLAAAIAAQAVLGGAERQALAGIVPDLVQLPAEAVAELLEGRQLVRLELQAAGLADGGRPNRLGVAYAAALRIVRQLAG